MQKTIQIVEFYGENACRKLELPLITEEMYICCLNKQEFGLKENLSVKMEVLDDTWCFSESEKYQVYFGKQRGFLKKLQHNDTLQLVTSNRETFIIIVRHEKIEIETFQKYVLDKKQIIRIGWGKDNTIILQRHSFISKEHLKIYYQGEEWFLQDLSTNGYYINGNRGKKDCKLCFGDEIRIFDVEIYFLGSILAIRESQIEGFSESFHLIEEENLKWITNILFAENKIEAKKFFLRSSRITPAYEQTPFLIEGPPEPREQPKRSLFMTLGPSLTMALPMLLSFALMGRNPLMGAGMFLGSSVIGAFWAYMNLREQKKNVREEEENRVRKYKRYLQRKEAELKKIYEENTDIIRKMYPSATELTECPDKTSFLWNRNRGHEDFLMVRLGTGNMAFQVPIQIPQERFRVLDDGLLHEPERIKKLYQELKKVPLGVDLRRHCVIGLVGGKQKEGVYPVLRNMIAQIAMANCYTDTKIVLIGNKEVFEDERLMNCVKWLPHFWDDGQSVRFMGDEPESISQTMNTVADILKNRRKESIQKRENIGFCPWIVVLVTDLSLIQNSRWTDLLYNDSLAVTTVICAQDCKELPNECEYIIENDASSFCGMYSVTAAKKDQKEITYDVFEYTALERLVHQLASVRVPEREQESEIPEKLTFMEMYKAKNLLELNVSARWKHSKSYESIRVPIGMKQGGQICYLDIHEDQHGPHGLAAGTVGSGKSEVLQSYLLSLAVSFSPEDINFFIIDFKGGAMARLFEKVPHMIGEISNLSGSAIRRAMVSIKSEIVRREDLFKECGVGKIYEYTKLYKNGEVSRPLPHFLIVIDEFA